MGFLAVLAQKRDARAAAATVVYTDGGCSLLHGVGAFAWRARSPSGETDMHCQGFAATTNNRMELMAICDALTTLSPYEPLTIVSDSAYCVDGVNHIPGWLQRAWKTVEGKPVKNRDLWETMPGLLIGRDVAFKKVKGHSGNAENEFVDTMCTAEMRRMKKIRAAGGALPLDLGYVQ